MTAWTDEDFKAFDEHREKLETYTNRSNEDLIQIFKDDDAEFEDKDYALQALKKKKEPSLPDLFLDQIKNTKNVEWKFFIIENSYYDDGNGVKFNDKQPILRELLLQNLQELERHFDGIFRPFKERSREEWRICSCLMRYIYLVRDNEVDLLDKTYPYLEKSNVNQKIHIYRPFHYCLFEGISEKLLDFIRKDCQNHLANLPSKDHEKEELTEKKVCFNNAMEVLYLNDHEEFQKNCKILENNDYGWLAESLNRNTKRFVEEGKQRKKEYKAKNEN